MFLFGVWSLSEGESNCFALEFPDTTQYSENPLKTDFDKFQGLNYVNVTARFQTLIWAGFIVEILILLLIILNMVASNKYAFISNFLGYCSLVWFICLLFGRFDHYGRTCSGDHMKAGDNKKTEFPNLAWAGNFFRMFVTFIGAMSTFLFVVVLLYSCFKDSRVDSEDKNKDAEQDKKE